MNNISSIAFPVTIGIISFGIGLSLKFRDFRRVFLYPKAILTGLVSQLILLPLVAFLIIYFWPVENVYKVGFILIAACPGGITSNFVTFILKGRVALSVSLTAFNSIFILFSIPLFINIATHAFLGSSQGIELSIGKTFGDIFYSVVLPVVGGIIFNELTPERFTQKLETPVRVMVTILLLLMVVIVLFFEDDRPARNILQNLHLLIPLVILNAGTMTGAYYLLRTVNLDHRSRYTIAVEVGLQNSALAIFIATTIMDNPQFAIMPILYGSFSLFSSWGIGYLLKRYCNVKQVVAKEKADSEC